MRALSDGDPGALCRRPGRHLIAHERDYIRGRADPRQPGVLDLPRRGRIFGKHSVPGVNRLRARLPRDLDNSAKI
jgi:hypothetical protein